MGAAAHRYPSVQRILLLSTYDSVGEPFYQGVSAFNRGEYPTAVSKLRECASIALNSFRAHYYLGLALIGERQYLLDYEAEPGTQ